MYVRMYVCILCAGLVPVGARRGHQILWNWGYKWLWAIKQVLETKSRASAKVVSALNPEPSLQPPLPPPISLPDLQKTQSFWSTGSLFSHSCFLLVNVCWYPVTSHQLAPGRPSPDHDLTYSWLLALIFLFPGIFDSCDLGYMPRPSNIYSSPPCLLLVMNSLPESEVQASLWLTCPFFPSTSLPSSGYSSTPSKLPFMDRVLYHIPLSLTLPYLLG